MSPAEEAFWRRANARAKGLTPELARAILRAFAILRESLSDAQLVRLIESGNIERLLTEVLDQRVMDRAFIPVRERIRNQVERNVKYFANDLPRGGKVDGVIAVSFDVLNPKTIEAIRELDTKVIQTLQQDTREVVRAYVENGLRDGKNPRAFAKQIRTVVGMSPTQEANAQKYEAREIEKGTPAAKVEKRVAAYRKRAVAVNAETNARTASLDAMKQGQRLSWEEAANKGIVDRSKLTKTWRGTLDARERPEHVALEGATVPFDSPYPNGEMEPGSSTFNCRCVSIVRVA